MKSQFLSAAFFSAVLLTIPSLTFAGGQPAKVRKSNKSASLAPAEITRAVQQGKGAGTSRRQLTLSKNAGRPQESARNMALGNSIDPMRSTWADSAFVK